MSTQPAAPATIRSVAALAGVSVAAVSRFVNHKQRFTPEVEARMAQAIAQLGYRGNAAARSVAAELASYEPPAWVITPPTSMPCDCRASAIASSSGELGWTPER